MHNVLASHTGVIKWWLNFSSVLDYSVKSMNFSLLHVLKVDNSVLASNASVIKKVVKFFFSARLQCKRHVFFTFSRFERDHNVLASNACVIKRWLNVSSMPLYSVKTMYLNVVISKGPLRNKDLLNKIF